jgi:carbon starvation protein
MFGAANQLLATIALAIGTSYIINRGRARYAWVTIIPMIFVGITTLTAGIENITNIYWPQMFADKTHVQGTINLVLTLVIIFCVLSVLIDAIPKWFAVIKGKRSIIQEN